MQIKINGIDINYEVIGEGKPVILLHGWLTDMETMRPIANNLSQSFKCYLVDVIGFGKSGLPESPMNTDDFGDFLAELVKKLDIQKPILIGHSNGGRIIMNAAGRDLFPIEKIVLMDCSGIKPKRTLEYYIKVGIAKVGKACLSILPKSSSIKEKLTNKVGSKDYQNSPQVLKDTMKIIVNEDQSQKLPNIKVPTLLIWGGLDKATPISDAKKIESLIPDCGLVEYPYGTHYAYLENINNVNLVLNSFLTSK